MVAPAATPDDVRRRLNLPDTDDFAQDSGISNEDIQTYLEDAAFENARHNDTGSMSDTHRKQIEWRLAGLKILAYRKGLRAYHQQSLGSMSRSYEAKSIEELRNELRDLDPSGKLADTSKVNASLGVPNVK